MPVQELRARIVKLETEINLQKKLLKKLEQDISLAQRQLNAALDPVARLPIEISSEIFLLSLAPSACGAQHVPIVLLNICNAWTNIALATPLLWTAHHIHFPCGDGLAEVLPTWFQRARNRPLSITISLQGLSSNWNPRIFAVLWKNGGQLKHLEISDDDDFEIDSDAEDETLDLFGNTTLASLLSLETLTIRCQHRLRYYRTSQILELLRRTPNVVECDFGFIKSILGSDYPSIPMLALSATRRLVFGEQDSDDSLLRHLLLPALETLSVPMNDLSGKELLDFVQRSGPPLQNLTVLRWPYYWRNVDLLECLRLLPSLARFRWIAALSAVTDLFAAMADSPSLLPNLRHLNITLMPNAISDFYWTTLVHALSTRRMQLSIVPVTEPPPANVLASLRELVLDGVEIHIGTEESNFVAV
ncbi:hypothetical protein C8R45DRAFT_1207568 [Mycena sanguinolenta]|nr:hypothetical protein C8R45DRAFT_1207568 [Mycena sanguinolenta]